MTRQFASEKNALGTCDRCGRTYKLSQLRMERVNRNLNNLRVCPSCWDPDHPQNELGRREYTDPQALRNPRPDQDIVASRYGGAIRYDFDTDTTADWTFTNATSSWADGITRVTTTGANGQMWGTDGTALAVGFEAADYRRVVMRAKTITRTAWAGMFTFSRDGLGWLFDVVVPEPPITNGDQWTVLNWDAWKHSNWTGTIDGLKFYLYSTSGAVWDVDYIRIEER